MNWLFEHTEITTYIVIGLIMLSMLVMIFFLAVKDIPEASELDGYMEKKND